MPGPQFDVQSQVPEALSRLPEAAAPRSADAPGVAGPAAPTRRTSAAAAVHPAIIFATRRFRLAEMPRGRKTRTEGAAVDMSMSSICAYTVEGVADVIIDRCRVLSNEEKLLCAVKREASKNLTAAESRGETMRFQFRDS
jgi:hypothetical protein